MSWLSMNFVRRPCSARASKCFCGVSVRTRALMMQGHQKIGFEGVAIFKSSMTPREWRCGAMTECFCGVLSMIMCHWWGSLPSSVPRMLEHTRQLSSVMSVQGSILDIG